MISPQTLRERFQAGQTYAQFQAEAMHFREELQRLYKTLSIPKEEAKAFQALVDRHGGWVGVLALAEDWCGDAVRAFPLLARLAESVDGLELRILGSEAPENEALVKAWPKGERRAIPIVVFLNEKFEEIGHWLERSHAGDAFFARTREALKDLPEERLFAELRPLMMEEFQNRLWQDTLAEWRALLAGGA